jgi:hypothetical protein
MARLKRLGSRDRGIVGDLWCRWGTWVYVEILACIGTAEEHLASTGIAGMATAASHAIMIMPVYSMFTPR